MVKLITIHPQAKKVITTAMEYTVAMSIELARRALPTEDDGNLKRSLELSAYFTVPKLELVHRQLTLVAAMMFAASKNNFGSALGFANRILANGGSPRMLERVRHLLFFFLRYSPLLVIFHIFPPLHSGSSLLVKR